MPLVHRSQGEWLICGEGGIDIAAINVVVDRAQKISRVYLRDLFRVSLELSDVVPSLIAIGFQPFVF